MASGKQTVSGKQSAVTLKACGNGKLTQQNVNYKTLCLAAEVERLCETGARVGKGGRKAIEVIGVHEQRIKEWLHNLGL